jgi:hypothetical protein
MKNVKNLMFARQLMAGMTSTEIREINYALYNHDDEVVCFDAYHLDENNIPSGIYTWYIPQELRDLSWLLLEGTIVEVENLNDTAQVVVSHPPYRKTMEMHTNDVHPYCALLAIISQPEGE